MISETSIRRPVLEWSVARRRFEMWCAYEQRHIPKEAGFAWDPSVRVWYTERSRAAVKMIKFAEPATKEQLLYQFGTPLLTA